MPDVTLNRTLLAQQAQQQQQTAAPSRKGDGKFGRILGAIAGGALNVVAPGAGTIVSELIGGSPADKMQSMLEDNQRAMAEMIALQNDVQKQTQTFALLTNIMKAKHDAEMAAVHNLKS